jgi:hypothetical protein
MTRTPFDTFSKQLLEEFLSPLGTVDINREVPGESRFIDVWFVPSEFNRSPDPRLGLLGEIATSPCLLEPYRNPPNLSETRSCLLKLFETQANVQRQAKRDNRQISEDLLPHLWILTPTASEAFLNQFGAAPDPNWGSGIYFLPNAFRSAIVAIHQLPKTPETLWLRLLGRDRVQQQAIEEVLTLSMDDPLRSQILNLLTTWRITMRLDTFDESDQISLMAINQAYLQWEQEKIELGRQEGQQAVIENILRARFGEVDRQLADIIPEILKMTAEQYTPLLLQLSREQLIQQFQSR